MVKEPETKKAQKKTRIFQLAKELKIQTPNIVEFLESKGFDVGRKQMQPVDDDMYLALLQKFDKARYAQYQLEHSTDPEAIQKRDSERLRKEEKEKLLAAKPINVPKPEESSTKKIELPQFKDYVVEAMSEFDVKSPEPKPDGIDDAKLFGDVDGKDEIEVKATEIPLPVIEKKEKPDEKSSLKNKFAELGLSEIEETDKEDSPEDAIDLDKLAANIKKKIELPIFTPLKIIEKAKKNIVVDPEVTHDIESKPKSEEKKSAEDSKSTSGTKTGKRRLKRKKIPNEADKAGESLKADKADNGSDFRKELNRLDRQRQSDRKGAAPNVKWQGKEKPKEAAPAEKTGRKRRRLKVSEVDVDASIKETLAKIEGRGKGRKKVGSAKDANVDSTDFGVLKVPEYLTTQELAILMDVPYQGLIQKCIEMGMIISINQRLDKDLMELLASEFEIEIEFTQDAEEEEAEVDDDSGDLTKRSPVVTIMGHVDHGKTTLLDHLRNSSIAKAEVGGITQHIGAYEVVYKDEKITFLDTPGHEAFTAMRARGAQITDIVVLVVAADDRVMPQTIEAIDHARSAGTPIVVAVNKVDKPAADPEKIYKQLADNNILVEKWSGKVQSAEISAKHGQGIDDLLAEILVTAEVLELKANPNKRSWGVVIESRLDRGLGAVATILVQNGTLKIGDPVVVGNSYGKVRSLYNEYTEKIKFAGPSTPVQVVGFNGVPQAGDRVIGYESEKEAKETSQKRQRQLREVSARKIKTLTLEQASMRMKEDDLSDLPLLIKGDVHGSIEVLSDALMKLSTDEVKVNIVLKGVGGITESDVLLAAASEAIIIGFHVHPNVQARELARREHVEIRLYRIIHEVVDEIHSSLEGMLAPTVEERTLGSLEIRQTFKVSRMGTIAGSYVVSGKIGRKNKVRIIRDSIEIWSGNLSSLKRFKDDVREVTTGFECGLLFDGFRDARVGDMVEVFENYEVQRKLEAT